MDRVRLAVSALGLVRANPPPGVLSISVGIAELRDHGETCDDWLRRADAALYRAKGAGRDRIEVDDSPVDVVGAAPSE
jgi:diguanylate cyclase (GGDEF)-like protein